MVDTAKNGSFEQGIGVFIYGWGAGSTNFSRSMDDPVDGAYALKYEGTGCNPATQMMDISANAHYELSVWMKILPDSKGSVIFDTDDKFDDTCQFVIDERSSGKWIHKTSSFFSGDQTRLHLRCFTTGDFNGICYWDNISLMLIE